MHRWGILATGNISTQMVQALHAVPGAEVTAVGSRSRGSAEQFARTWEIERTHGSYQGVIEDPNVDIIYVGTPHTLHHSLTVAALQGGKHVLCEKPLTINAAEAEECVAAATEAGKFLMEAMWMRFIPATVQVRDWVAQGRIGQVRLIRADFCIDVPYDPRHRLFNPELGGGALFDLGIYPVSLAAMLLGWPTHVSGRAVLTGSGVDELNTLLCAWETGEHAGAQGVLTSASRFDKPAVAEIIGSGGRITMHPQFHHTQKLSLTGEADIGIPYIGNGYAHQIMEVHRCIENGLVESPGMPWSESVRTMRLFDRLHGEWGCRIVPL